MHQAKQRLHLLDGLRGICAISIMVYHYINWSTGLNPYQISTFGVYIFFILSGFSMWYVYADTEVSAKNLRDFYVARFARIFPLYLLVHLKLVGHGFNPAYFKGFLLNTTFLFGLAAPGLTSGVTGGWSIGIEWVFYLAFPLMMVFLKDMRVIVGMLFFAILINQMYVGSLFRQATLVQAWFDYANFPVFLVYFIAGILGAELYNKFQALHPRGMSRKKQRAARLGMVVLLALLFTFPSPTIESFLWGNHFPLLLCMATLIVFLGSLVTHMSSWEIRIYKFLGDISFSAYLIHYLVFKHGNRLRDDYFPDLVYPYNTLVFGFATIVISYLLYRFYEMPARKFIVRKFSSSSKAATLLPPA